MTLLWCDIWNR